MTAGGVPLEAWQVGPWNRWAYQHVADVVPTRAVPRGAGGALELPERPEALEDLGFDRGDGTRTTVGAYLDAGWVDGLAVVHDGALVLERYRNGMGPGTRHISQSVAKSVLGLLVGVLAGRGAVDPGVPVTDLVPEVRGSGYDGATVAHLLDMTAAVDFDEDYATSFWRYDVACGWHPPHPDAPASSVLEFLPSIGPLPGGAHGRAFAYLSPNTDLLGIAAERAGGRPLPDLLARELWGPMGAGDDAEIAVDPAGTALPSGGLCATLRDYARLGLLVLDGGRGVVGSDWIASLGAGDPAAFAARGWPEPGSGETGYARQWWRRDGRTVARGIHGQHVAVDHGARVVVAILASWPDAIDDAHVAAQRHLVAAVCAELAGR